MNLKLFLCRNKSTNFEKRLHPHYTESKRAGVTFEGHHEIPTTVSEVYWLFITSISLFFWQLWSSLGDTLKRQSLWKNVPSKGQCTKEALETRVHFVNKRICNVNVERLSLPLRSNWPT
ncbi:Hypothetical predicted protein [Xyrichtys novacula]|uniref:Uncharacterized protein n=1 Tax=Xyrichtys novacula TaxID=13765 RepID=A0AAV1FXV6_XYRNO|nr:Hypothetical predicted protein [Xyrichtys novacula]